MGISEKKNTSAPQVGRFAAKIAAKGSRMEKAVNRLKKNSTLLTTSKLVSSDSVADENFGTVITEDPSATRVANENLRSDLENLVQEKASSPNSNLVGSSKRIPEKINDVKQPSIKKTKDHSGPDQSKLNAARNLNSQVDVPRENKNLVGAQPFSSTSKSNADSRDSSLSKTSQNIDRSDRLAKRFDAGIGLKLSRPSPKRQLISLLHNAKTQLKEFDDVGYIKSYSKGIQRLLDVRSIETINVLYVARNKTRNKSNTNENPVAIIGASTVAPQKYIDTYQASYEDQDTRHRGPVDDESSSAILKINQLCLSWSEVKSLSPNEVSALREINDVVLIDHITESIDTAQQDQLILRLANRCQAILLVREESYPLLENTISYRSCSEYSELIHSGRIKTIDCLEGELVQAAGESIFAAFSAGHLEEFLLVTRLNQLLAKLQEHCRREQILTEKAIEICTTGEVQKDGEGDERIGQLITELATYFESITSKTSNGKQTNYLSNLEYAMSHVSTFDFKDLVREDELDIHKFKGKDIKYAKRLNRFRVINKLGYIWKVDQSYIEKLHRAVLAEVIERGISGANALQVYLASKSENQSIEPKTDSEKAAHTCLKQKVISAQLITKALRSEFDISRFRQILYSKRGQNAPIESQQGMLKELKESRMFVSQLMAYGMLFAILFGGTYAVDVMFGLVSGSSENMGGKFEQAAKDSRILGRQIRMLIQAVAGIAIVIYIGMKLYLKNASKILEEMRVVSLYREQLEEAVKEFFNQTNKYLEQAYSENLNELKTLQSTGSLDTENTFGTTKEKSERRTTRIKPFTSYLKKVLEIDKWVAGQMARKTPSTLAQIGKTVENPFDGDSPQSGA